MNNNSDQYNLIYSIDSDYYLLDYNLNHALSICNIFPIYSTEGYILMKFLALRRKYTTGCTSSKVYRQTFFPKIQKYIYIYTKRRRKLHLPSQFPCYTADSKFRQEAGRFDRLNSAKRIFFLGPYTSKLLKSQNSTW